METINPNDWLNEYGDELVRFATFRVKNQEIAEDLVQDTFLSAFKSYDSYKGEASVKTWLFAILKNKIFDYYKKDLKKSEITDCIDDKDPSFNSFGIWKVYVPNWAKSPNEQLENKELIEVFNNCKDKLKKDQAKVFTMKYLDGIDSEEICKVLDITKSNYWIILHRTRMQLRKCIEDNWFKN
mgnify:CR=1 FL=1